MTDITKPVSTRLKASDETVAGNGLLHRRALLGRGLMIAGAAGVGATTSVTGAEIGRAHV